MVPPHKYLLPSTSELQLLSDEKVRIRASLANSESEGLHRYAKLGMVCGVVSFLGCLGSYGYLVRLGHDAAAGIVLGTTVLAVVGKMIRGR